MKKLTSKDGGDADKTYGLYYNKQGHSYIGDKQIVIIDDNIVIEGKEYEGTPGLWELLINKKPDSNIYTDQDYNTYAEIMIKTNSIHRGNDPNDKRPKASMGWKWKTILKDIWKDRAFVGQGMSSDANALLDRLDLLMASMSAGNTRVKDEIISILNQLKSQKVIGNDSYKKIISQL